MVRAGAEPFELRHTVRDWIAGAALFAATAAVVLWQNAHVAVLFDLSYVLNTAARIAAGQMPYRDFPLPHAPLTFLTQAAIIRLTGRVFFHQVLYVALAGGVATVITWRIAFKALRQRVANAWIIALLLAAPLVFLGIYCIVPTPEYDCDCALWILVALWLFERLDTKPGIMGGFFAGVFACVPAFCKQNMGLPFLAAIMGAVLLVLALKWTRRAQSHAEWREARALFAMLAGIGSTIVAAALVLHWTAGIGNSIRWTIGFAAERRLPALGLMLDVFRDLNLMWTLPCVAIALLLLSATRDGQESGAGEMHPAGAKEAAEKAGMTGESGKASVAGAKAPPSCCDTYGPAEAVPLLQSDARMSSSAAWKAPIGLAGFTARPFKTPLSPETAKAHWVQIAAFALLAAPFVFTLASLLMYYDDADSRGDALLALWPLIVLLAAALAMVNLIRLPRAPSLGAFLPLVMLAAITGTLMSQQLWGSTYAIWPLLILLVAELLAFLSGFKASVSARWMLPALAALVSVTLLVCGAFYTASEERLSYAELPDEPAQHSAFPQLAGLSTPGPYLPEIDELLRYAQANIPWNDGIVLMPGEEPFYFATGRAARFPLLYFDPTIDPYSPAEIAALVRTRNIRWLIVKTDLQTKGDPTPDRAATMQLLMQEFTPAAHLRGYDVYRAKAAE